MLELASVDKKKMFEVKLGIFTIWYNAKYVF